MKRVYDPPSNDDGSRILVERLWPRGLSKEAAAIDFWSKETAPSNELRRWFGHEPAKWDEFKRRYFEELRERQTALEELRQWLEAGPACFVFASRESEFNNAVALKDFLTSS